MADARTVRERAPDPFPLATSVVVAFTSAQAGRVAALRTLRGYLTGLPGFAAFFVLVALLT